MAEADRYFVFRISNDGMARSYANITESVLGSIRSKATEWHSGKPVGPSKGNFHIILYPNPAWTKNEYVPVELLLSCYRLYLEAFKVDGVWYQFPDSPVQIPPDAQGTRYERLGFGGSYHDLQAGFTNFKVGTQAFSKSYKTLAGYPNNSSDEDLKHALVVMIVMFAEALRFTDLQEWAIDAMGSQYDWLLDDFGNFSLHFTCWEKYCGMIRVGRDNFQPINDKNTFEELLNFVRVLLYKED